MEAKAGHPGLPGPVARLLLHTPAEWTPKGLREGIATEGLLIVVGLQRDEARPQLEERRDNVRPSTPMELQ